MKRRNEVIELLGYGWRSLVVGDAGSSFEFLQDGIWHQRRLSMDDRMRSAGTRRIQVLVVLLQSQRSITASPLELQIQAYSPTPQLTL